MLKLYHNDMSTCSQKVRFALAEKQLEFEGVELNLRAGDQHKPEFVRLNPKALVPVLVHDELVLAESNIINEYLDERFTAAPLMPESAAGRAEVRAWTQRLDTGLHLHIAALSFGIAFREQLLAIHDTEEKLEAFVDGVTVPEMQAFYRDMLADGLDAPRFQAAVRAWDKTLADMEVALTNRQWLTGDALTLADIALAPYLTRLDHLGLDGLWAERPDVAAWYRGITDTAGYRRGIADWFNPKYLELMRESGARVWPRVETMLAAG